MGALNTNIFHIDGAYGIVLLPKHKISVWARVTAQPPKTPQTHLGVMILLYKCIAGPIYPDRCCLHLSMSSGNSCKHLRKAPTPPRCWRLWFFTLRQSHFPWITWRKWQVRTISMRRNKSCRPFMPRSCSVPISRRFDCHFPMVLWILGRSRLIANSVPGWPI